LRGLSKCLVCARRAIPFAGLSLYSWPPPNAARLGKRKAETQRGWYSTSRYEVALYIVSGQFSARKGGSQKTDTTPQKLKKKWKSQTNAPQALGRGVPWPIRIARAGDERSCSGPAEGLHRRLILLRRPGCSPAAASPSFVPVYGSSSTRESRARARGEKASRIQRSVVAFGARKNQLQGDACCWRRPNREGTGERSCRSTTATDGLARS